MRRSVAVRRVGSGPTQASAGDERAHGAFGLSEWLLVASAAAIWGSSYVFIEVGLESFGPGVVALARLLLGTVALALFPAARAPIGRSDRVWIALLGIVWMGLPLILFPVAQQWIDSSLAGMINGGVPLTTAAISALVLRRLPRRRHLVGLFVGLAGLVAVSLPGVQGARATAMGTLLVLVAVCLYGIGINLAVPLQRRYGALPVLLRAQVASVMVVAPVGFMQLPDASWSWTSALAMLPLGILGTGLAYVAMTVLVGRVGAARGSVAIYFVPLVAILLGVAFRGEEIAPLALGGVPLVFLGAGLTGTE